MADFIIEQKSFDMQKLNSEFEEYSKSHNIGLGEFSKVQLVTEEYLTNILFPNFEGSVEISISRTDKGLTLIFSHKGADCMNKITDNSFLSFKILDNKTKEIHSHTKDGITSVEFVIG